MPGNFDESKHPRAPDGKFGSGGGASSGSEAPAGGEPAEVSLSDRAKASLKDRAFVAQHRERLQAGANAARSYYTATTGERVVPDAVADEGIRSEAERIHQEADDEAAIGDAIASGHVNPAPRVELDRYEAALPDLKAEVASVSTELHESSKSAVDSVRSLQAVNVVDPDTGDGELDDLDLSSLDDSIASTSEAMGGEIPDADDDADSGANEDDELLSAGEPDDPGEFKFDPDDSLVPETFEDEDDYEDYPEISDEENAEARRENRAAAEHEHAEALAAEVASQRESHEEKVRERDAWKAAKARNSANVAIRAVKAQDALEALHERQIDAIARLSAVETETSKLREAADEELSDLDDDALVKQDAFEDLELDEDDEIVDPEMRAKYSAAHDASESLLARSRAEREDLLDPPFDYESIDTIKEASKDVAAAIKRLSKLTKRPPKIAKKPTKTKKSNRPGDTSAATVFVMARHRLRLSKLQFVSLVDRPAQETATVRLIKRAGETGPDRVRTSATARLVKLADGPSPLAYFWAFTCTDEHGQPYHDLQGDAVDPDSYIKAAEEFMHSGAAVDDMHGSQQLNRVAFAFPMDSDIASGMFGSAIGKQVKTSGLMIAIRPSPTELAMLKSGERTGVSIAGLGVREAMEKGMPPWMKGKGKKAKPGDKKKPRRYGKSAVLTSLEAGHQHTIDLEAPCSHWGDSLSTSHQTADGAEQSHCHAWVYDPMTGAISIAADSGHTHTVDAVVSVETMAEAMREDEHDEMPCAAPCSEPASGASVVVVSARAPGISTPSDEAATVTQQEQQMATDQDKIAELTKTVERLTALASLTDLQKAYHATLKGTESAAFLAKSATERAAAAEPFEIAKRVEQEVVYQTKGGEIFRKSDDPRLVAMAKRADAAEAAGEQVTLEKRASADLSHFAKGLNVTAAIVKAVDGIADEAVRKEAHESIRGANAALKQLSKAHGYNPGSDPVGDDPASKLEALAKQHAEANKVPFSKAYDAVMSTPEGAALYTAISTPRAN